MKGGSGGGSGIARRWRGLAIAVVFLVFLSRLVPLGFLLGLHCYTTDFTLQGRKKEGSALLASLLTFQDQIYALDGLGHDYGLDIEGIKKDAVLHYNGNMKPWLELGIPKYKAYWKKFLNRGDRYLSECSVNR